MSECVILFCNIGNRDVKANPEKVSYPERVGNRERGQFFKAHFTQIANELSLPILGRTLHYLRQEQGISHIAKVVLFATDQPKDHRRHDTDTCFLGEVVQLLLEHTYSDFIASVHLELVQGDPSAYDECFELYAKLLKKYVGAGDRYFLEATGGTPACSMALYLQGIRLFGVEACQPIYVPYERAVYQSDIMQLIRAMMVEQTAVSRLHAHDFYTATTLLNDADIYIQSLATYARLRLLFDFDGAQYHLEQAITKGRGRRRAFAQSLRSDLLRLKDSDTMMLLREVYWNAVVCWQNGRFADFLGRVFRFQEGVIRHLLETYYEGLDTSDKYAWRDYLSDEKHAHLVTYFKDIKTDKGSSVNYKQMNRYTTLLLLKHLAKNEVAADPTIPLKAEQLTEIKGSLVLLERIEGLASLRNKTVLAHGFQGVSHEIILQAYPDGFDPLVDMQVLCKTLGGVGENPFQKIADFLETELQEAS